MARSDVTEAKNNNGKRCGNNVPRQGIVGTEQRRAFTSGWRGRRYYPAARDAEGADIRRWPMLENRRDKNPPKKHGNVPQ